MSDTPYWCANGMNSGTFDKFLEHLRQQNVAEKISEELRRAQFRLEEEQNRIRYEEMVRSTVQLFTSK